MNRSMPAFWIRSNRSNRWAGVPNEILNFMSNAKAHRPPLETNAGSQSNVQSFQQPSNRKAERWFGAATCSALLLWAWRT
jgi:hypothetical protein